MTIEHESTSSHMEIESPGDLLYREPYRFEFVQAVRLLRWIALTSANKRSSVGTDNTPQADTVRFRSVPAHAFPQGAVTRIRTADDSSRTEMQIAFYGLFGPSGVLPRHYTQLVIDRVRSRDTTLRDFLDLFNHRTTSLFYQAGVKYRLPMSYENAVLGDSPHSDDFLRGIYSLAGWGLEGVRDRLDFPDSTFAFYSGHFSHARANAASLQAMVAERFGLRAEVRQLFGKWMYLDSADQSRLTNDRRDLANNQLGMDVVVGDRVWGIENSFRLRLGPMDYRQFLDLTPAGSGLQRLAQFVRSYVGPTFDFDVQLILKREDVPECQLSGSSVPPTARLGWNTWLRSAAFQNDADDAVFQHDGNPSTTSV